MKPDEILKTIKRMVDAIHYMREEYPAGEEPYGDVLREGRELLSYLTEQNCLVETVEKVHLPEPMRDAMRHALREATADMQAVIDRWDSPSWKDLPHTADYIHRLRGRVETINKLLKE